MDAFSRLTCRFSGELTRGHRVASGLSGDARFPGGTIAMQVPCFRELGLDLSGFHHATLNVAITPLKYETRRATHTFRQVRWHPVEPAEDFSFFDAAILKPETADHWVRAFVYRPHPETKPAHFQPPDALELLAAEWINGLVYGDRLEIRVDPEQLAILA